MFIPNFMNFCIFKTELKVKRGLGDKVFIKFKVESDPPDTNNIEKFLTC